MGIVAYLYYYKFYFAARTCPVFYPVKMPNYDYQRKGVDKIVSPGWLAPRECKLGFDAYSCQTTRGLWKA